MVVLANLTMYPVIWPVGEFKQPSIVCGYRNQSELSENYTYKILISVKSIGIAPFWHN